MAVREWTWTSGPLMLTSLLTLALLGWSFYAQNFVAFPAIRAAKFATAGVRLGLCIAAAVPYNVFSLLAMANLLRCAVTDNSPEANPPNGPLEEATYDSADESQRIDGTPRCRKCGGWKPERCHHCSSCNKCCLKMDHHCLSDSLLFDFLTGLT